jgi:hypothetical protein
MAFMLMMLFLINKIDYNQKKKTLKISNTERNGLINNRTFIINRKNTAIPACTSTPSADGATCEKSYDDLLAKTTSEAWGTGTGIEAAVDLFINSCPTTACAQDCTLVVSDKTIGTTDSGGLHTGLAASCEPARQSKTTTCPASGADTAQCAEAFLEAKSLGSSTPWKGKDIRDSINNFIDKCPTTTCQSACSTLIVNKNYKTVINGFSASFLSDCVISKSSISATCVATESDTAQCEAAYNKVVTASEPTTWGDGIGVVAAVNSFITNCKKRLCTDDCRNLVNNKNLGTSIADFKTTFQDKCKAVTSPAEGGEEKSSSLRSTKIYNLLIAISFALASIHLIL